MPLHILTPPMSDRMAMLWAIAPISNTATIEFGSMGHMAYGRVFLDRLGKAGNIVSTHINETDIALGDTSRIERVVAELLASSEVRAIFLLPSTVPAVIGTDLEAIAKELSREYPQTKIIALQSEGINRCGHKGVEHALVTLARAFAHPHSDQISVRRPSSFNIIGSCSDEFSFLADAEELVRLMHGAFDMYPSCIMTAQTSAEELEYLGQADINLVMRREGFAAAKQLEQDFGTPYLFSKPCGVTETIKWLDHVSQICKKKAEAEFVQREKRQILDRLKATGTITRRFMYGHRDQASLTLVGSADTVKSIAGFAEEAFGFPEVSCLCDCPCQKASDLKYADEQVINTLSAHQQGLLMGSAELLDLAGRNPGMQIANPDYNRWRFPHTPPLVGFRGADHLACTWANEMQNILMST